MTKNGVNAPIRTGKTQRACSLKNSKTTNNTSPTNAPSGPIMIQANGAVIKKTNNGTRKIFTGLGDIFFAKRSMCAIAHTIKIGGTTAEP